MSDKEEKEDCNNITSRQFNGISEQMSDKMVDRICSDISNDSQGKDPLSTALSSTLANKVTQIIQSDEGKRKLQTTVFETIRLALNSSRRNPILLYSLLKNNNKEISIFIKGLFERAYDNSNNSNNIKNVGSFLKRLFKILRDPPSDLYNIKKTGGNKTRARRNKSKKRRTRSLRKKQRGGVIPPNQSNTSMVISQNCDNCPDDPTLNNLIDGYKDKLVSEMAKNIESDKHDIMERLLNAVRIYTRKNGKYILKSIINGIGKTIIPSGIDNSSKKIIFLQALHAARDEVSLAIYNTNDYFTKENNAYVFNPNTNEFLDQFMITIKSTISKHYK
jgi:hypothetical protein